MQKMKHFLTLTLALLSAIGAGAQAQAEVETETQQWTLEECMLYAVEQSPVTNIQAAQNRIVGQDYLEAIGRLLPNLGASVDASFNFGRSLGDDNVYAEVNSFSNSYQVSTGLTLFDGLRNVNGIRLQRINRITGRHALAQKRDEVAYATMEAFFNVMYYTEMVALAESQLEESRANLRQTERMEELGLKGFPDVAEMRAQEAANSYTLTRQQNLLAIGIILLKEKMNFPVEGELEIVHFDFGDETGEFGGGAVKTLETAAGLYARALGYLPRAQVATSTAAAQEMALRHARGARFPTISLGAGYSTGFFRNMDGDEYASFREQFSGKRGYWAGATLSIPVFNGFTTSANIRRTKFRTDIAKIERDATLRALYTEIEQAVADMNGQADQHTQAVRQRESVAVAHDVNRRKYEEGLLSALELHTSSNRLVQARADELNSRLTYILKKRMVDYYGGMPLIPIAPVDEN
ncbi:MAG: TolC family protein [Alistipes sp.]|jgi:outer membrane protein|nr:TolC family protein [Alistipes sp.]